MPILPDTRWRPIVVQPSDPHSEPGERSPEAADAVLDCLDVEGTPRYQPDAHSTYCNIALLDYLEMMGSPFPEKYRDMYLSANVVVKYVQSDAGKDAGWTIGTLQDARKMASTGRPTLGAWLNDHGHGHVVVVRPGGDFWQAGRKNYAHARLEQCFGMDKVPSIVWAWKE